MKTLRDEIALVCLKEFLSSYEPKAYTYGSVSRQCWKFADQMLRDRDEAGLLPELTHPYEVRAFPGTDNEYTRPLIRNSQRSLCSSREVAEG